MTQPPPALPSPAPAAARPTPAPPRTAGTLPVQRALPVRGVPLRRPSPHGADATARGPLPVAPLTPPPAAAPLALAAGPAAGAPSASATAFGPTVQRLPSFRSGSGSGSGRSIGALASAAAATMASTWGHLRPSSQHAPPTAPSPPTTPPPPTPPSEPPAAAGTTVSQGDPPPEYTAVPAGGFDPRELTEFQLDELVHRIIDRVTRLVRAELRMDRERIGRLRDPRA
ncbi:hypothetical protein [Streptomyces sp. NPDC048272]|uniref:hypothetical protein n=1 Tax=Streptomyces sp. NPDC048272 TaxID=3154616 RepID=UPI003430E7E0